MKLAQQFPQKQRSEKLQLVTCSVFTWPARRRRVKVRVKCIRAGSDEGGMPATSLNISPGGGAAGNMFVRLQEEEEEEED